MDVKVIDPDEVSERSIEALRLDAGYVDFSFPEALAEATRRVVSMHGPLSRNAAARLVQEPLRGLPGVEDATMDSIPDIIEQLVSLGDLVERDTADEGLAQARLLFTGMPRYVRLSNHLAVLLGCRPDGVPPVSDELEKLIEPNGCVRYIRLHDDNEDDVLLQLRDEGVKEIKPEQWLRSPRTEARDEYLERINHYLDAANPPGDLDGALVFDPNSPRHYYRGRWRPFRHPPDGIAVMRRPQAYGADRWSVARSSDGAVRQLVDLPFEGAVDRACDEAWRIMAALDAEIDNPPHIRATQLMGGRLRLDFDAPLPAWLHRQLTALGYPIARAQSALFSYSVEAEAAKHIRELAEQKLWHVWTDNTEDHP